MKAFASLHTDMPTNQFDHEVSYEGYSRVEIEFGDDFGNIPIMVNFPIIQADSQDIVNYIAIGSHHEGPGEIFLSVATMPMQLKDEPNRRTREFWENQGASPDQIKQIIAEYGFNSPSVCVVNVLPSHLNPIARVAYQLVKAGLMNAAELHPQLFEAINDALHNAGVPVLKVIRQSAAKMKPAVGLGVSLVDLSVVH